MRKGLLVFAALATAATVSAQPMQKSLSTVALKTFNGPVAAMAKQEAPRTKVMRTKGTNTNPTVYYGRPTGTYYAGMTDDGRSYYPMLFLPALADVTFPNLSADPSSTHWFMGENNIDSVYVTNNNFILSTNAASAYYGPLLVNTTTLANATDSFSIFQGGENYAQGGSYEGRLVTPDTIMPTSAWMPDNGFYARFTDSDSPFGDKTFTFDSDGDGTDEEYTQQYFYQIFEAPRTSYHITGLNGLFINSNGSGKLIGDNDTLTAYIYNTTTDQDGNTVLGDDLLGTFTATASTVGYQTSSQGNELGVLFFQNLQDDGFGGVANTPIDVNTGFAVVITGFQGTGLQMYFGSAPDHTYTYVRGQGVTGIDETLPVGTRFVGTNANGGSVDLSYIIPYYACISVNMFQDNVLVPDSLSGTDTEGNSIGGRNNLLTAPAEGGEAVSELNEPLYVYTAAPWQNGDGNDNYFFEPVSDDDDDSWFTASVNTDNFEQYGVTLVTFTCDPLPAGVSGRHCVVRFNGKGVTSAPVTIRQGNDQTDGIAGVTVKDEKNLSNEVYNLAGQRVNKSAKGLLIQNGKKFINK